MRDEECVQFLQNVLPRLHLRWAGFHKVRSQVCKRIQRRIKQLALSGTAEYRSYLEQHGDEWQQLDRLCQVSISRFYRDKQMFAFLEQTVLPVLAQRVLARGDDCLRVWSVGAASGEEPYTLAIIWQLQLKHSFPTLQLHIVATDADPNMIARSEAACYAYSSVKNLPKLWLREAFDQKDTRYCLKREFREAVQFRQHDLRQVFARLFSSELNDLILCRNLAFTYFDESLQQQTYLRLLRALRAGGALVIGIHEQLPVNEAEIGIWSDRLRIFEKLTVKKDKMMTKAPVSVGAPDPELKTSPILDEEDEDFDVLAQEDEDLPVCYFNSVAFADGSFVCSGSGSLLKCEKGLWIREGGCDPDNP